MFITFVRVCGEKYREIWEKELIFSTKAVPFFSSAEGSMIDWRGGEEEVVEEEVWVWVCECVSVCGCVCECECCVCCVYVFYVRV